MSVTFEEESALNANNRKWIEALAASGNNPKKLKDIPPIFFVMDLTWACNYDCRECIDGGAAGRSADMPQLPFEIIKDIVHYSVKHDVRGHMAMGGEIQLYNDNGKTIDDYFHLCADNNLPLSMVSNGSLLNQHMGAAKRVFSLPGSILRVSVNADSEHYKEQVMANYGLEPILESLNTLSGAGAYTMVTVVLWGEEAKPVVGFENVSQLGKIVDAVSAAGVNRIMLLPSRNAKDHSFLKLSEEELEYVDSLCYVHGNTHVNRASLFSTYEEMPASAQNKCYNPCPSNLLRALVGSNGKLYQCTDHRGEEDAVIGIIEKPGDFEKVWHSEERVRKQMGFVPKDKCAAITCMRYPLNLTLANAINNYSQDRNIAENIMMRESKSFQF